MYYHTHVLSANSKYLPETLAYRQRVLLDGGQIINLDYIDSAYRMLISAGLYSTNITVFGGANYGVKKNGSNLVEKLYDLSPNENDFVQATSNQQPVWSISGGVAKITYDGIDDSLINDSSTWSYYNVTASGVNYSTVAAFKRISGNNDFNLVVYDIAGNANLSFIRVLGTNELLEGRQTSDSGTGVARSSLSTIDLVNNYICTVTDGNQFYINGALDNVATGLGVQTRSGISRAVIGAFPQTPIFSNFDQFTIYNQAGALSNSNRNLIQDHMNELILAY